MPLGEKETPPRHLEGTEMFYPKPPPHTQKPALPHTT